MFNIGMPSWDRDYLGFSLYPARVDQFPVRSSPYRHVDWIPCQSSPPAPSKQNLDDTPLYCSPRPHGDSNSVPPTHFLGIFFVIAAYLGRDIVVKSCFFPSPVVKIAPLTPPH